MKKMPNNAPAPAAPKNRPVAVALVSGSATATGLFLGAAGAGALFGIFFILPLINHRVRRIGVVLSVALVWMGWWLFVLSRSQTLPLSLGALFLTGFSTTIVYVLNMGLLQVLPPPNMR